MPADLGGPGSSEDWLRHARSDLALASAVGPHAMGANPVLESVVTLTDYAVTMRYPADTEPIDEKELIEAIKLAEAVVRWAEGKVNDIPH